VQLLITGGGMPRGAAPPNEIAHSGSSLHCVYFKGELFPVLKCLMAPRADYSRRRTL
jgi:hypothetical protein